MNAIAVAVKQQAHTPGPWKINATGRAPIIGFDPNDGGPLLPIVGSVHGYDVAVAAANVALIAAAPDLLAALKAVIAIADRKTDEFDLARAAIAKAGA